MIDLRMLGWIFIGSCILVLVVMAYLKYQDRNDKIWAKKVAEERRKMDSEFKEFVKKEKEKRITF